MNNKKVQAQMKINVSFLADVTQLTKQLENATKKLNLDSSFSKDIANGLAKGFKEIYSNLDKMTEGLSRRGLSPKQYTAFFKEINEKLQDSIKVTQNLRKSLNNVFKSPENKQALKDLENFKKQLEEINKLSSSQKGAQTRQNTAIQKMKDEFGIDYNISKRTLAVISGRRSNGQGLTKGQQEWAANNGLDEAGLKRVLELYKQIAAQAQKIKDINNTAKDMTGQSSVDASAEYLQKQINKTEAVALLDNIHKENQIIINDIEKIERKLGEATEALPDRAEAEIKRSYGEAEDVAQGMQTINEVLSQFGIALSAGTIVKAFKELVKSAFDFYKSLDSALNEIYVVSNLSIGAVNNLKTNFIGMAKETGMALDDVTRSAVLFYQQGLNTDEVMEMTRVTSQFAKVAGIDATDAADKLTAAVNGYCLSAEDAASVADKFNKVAAASAADINELSTAFSKAAAQANQAGVSMDNYLSYIATVVEATREAPENIGTSLKTIFSRMQQIKTGSNTEDNTDVNQVETALKSVGIALRDTEGQLRDLEDIFDELGPKWQSLDRNTQAYLGTIIAGTRQQSRFITLMQNWDRVLELSEESANSAGQQALMHAKAMDSIESKLQQLTVAWQEFISKLGDSSLFKSIIEIATKFMNTINKGSTPIVALGATLGLLSKNLTKLDGPLGRAGKKMGEYFGNVKKLTPQNLRLAKSYINVQKELLKHTTAISTSKKKIEGLVDENEKLDKQRRKAIKTDGEQSSTVQKLTTQIEANNQAIEIENTNIEKHTQLMNKEKPELENLANAYDETVQGLQSAATATALLSVALPGLLGNLSGAASGFLTIGTAVTKLSGTIVTKGVPAFKAAEKAGKSAVTGIAEAIAATGIGAIIEAIAMVAVGAVMAIKSLVEAFGDQSKNIKESVDNVANSLEAYNNAMTKVKSADKLYKDYDKLSKKIYLTQKDQEKLNDLVQQLGDSLDIEVLEDKYGNLSISINDVTEKMKELREQANEARKELAKTENDEIEKYDHNGNVRKFYEAYLGAHKSEVRNALSDLETGIDTDKLATSAANVQKITHELKDAIIQDCEEVVEAYGGLGIEWSLTEDAESMIQAFNNANISSDKWNELYQTFDLLQNKIDSISYDQALNTVESAIKVWGDAAGLTTKQIQEMTNAIMNSLYDSSNLNNTINKYQTIIDKYTGDKYKVDLEDYYERKDTAYKNSTTMPNFFKQDDYEKEYEALQKKIQLVEEERDAYLELQDLEKKIANGETYDYDTSLNYLERRQELIDQYGFATEEEYEKAQKMVEMLGKFNDSAADFFNKVGLFDDSGVLEELQDNNLLSNILGAYRESPEDGARLLTDALVNIINTTDDEELRQAAKEKLDAVFKNIQVKKVISWTELNEDLDSLSSDLRKMNALLEDFNDTGAFTLETFADLCDILDGIDFGAVFDAGKMDQFVAAIENLELKFDASTGMITANGEALESLGQIQQAMTQAKLKQMADSLEADKAQLQATIYGIEAEIAANNDLIAYLKNASDAELSIDKVKAQGNAYYTDTMGQAADITKRLYMTMTTNSGRWAEASIKNAAAVGDAIKAAMTGKLGTANLGAELDKIVSDMQYEDTGSYGIIQMNTKDGKVERDAAIAALEDYNSRGMNTIKKLYSQMKGIEQMQGLLNQMSSADLGKLGTSKGSDTTKEIDKYIGKLKEIYNILNRIQVLEHRLSTLDAYSEIAKGEQYGSLLKERLGYNRELLDQYEFLTKEQKQFTNGYKDFINSVEGLEGVFDFDKFGQIIINWEKYDQLQDEAIDGETTLKEKADDVYETYTNMFEDLHGYFDNTIKYYKQVIALQQEMVDSYIEMEDKAAEAIKEIYQKILDTRLEAIDKEKEAIEELRQAREDARKDQQDAKAVTGLQTNLQRAMMDTSGASDIAFIKAQNDISDKLDEIADDKYSKMLDDILDRLDEEQNALQEEFDEMFEELDWLFSWLDADIMGDQTALYDLLQQTDEWNQSSFLSRQEMLDDWKTKFHTYYESMVDNPKGIYGIYDNIKETTERIKILDSNLQTSIANGSAEIAQTIGGWKVAQEQKNSAGSGNQGGGLGGNYTNRTYDTTTDYTQTITGVLSTVGGVVGALVGGSKKTESTFKVGDKVKSSEQMKDGGLNWVQQYKINGKGSTNAIAGWGGNWGLGGGAMTVDEVIYHNGTYYYMLRKDNGTRYGYFNGHQLTYKNGGMADFTGPAWLDGTPNQPEAVLTALQTEHFIKFTNALDHLFGNRNPIGNANSVSIDNISFNVASMSSPEDGEAAFNMFVSKFKEIGAQTGIKMNSFKNTL